MWGKSGHDAPVLDEADVVLEDEAALEDEEEPPPPAPGSPDPSTTTLPPQPTTARDTASNNAVRMRSSLSRSAALRAAHCLRSGIAR
jgi:hypothetical protein